MARVVAARIVGRVDHGVAGSALDAGRVTFPNGGGAAGEHGEASEQAAEHAVTDDQLWQRETGQRVLRGGGQGEQDAVFAERVAECHGAGAGDDDAGGGGAEQAVDRAEATGTGDEHPLAVALAADDAADRFVAGHQRVAHAGKGEASRRTRAGVRCRC